MFAFAPLYLYDTIIYQKYYVIMAPYNFTAALFFNNSAKIWYSISGDKIKRIIVPFKTYSYLYIISIPYFLYLYYISHEIIGIQELIISLILCLLAPINAHLGIFIILLKSSKSLISINFILMQLLQILILMYASVNIAPPIIYIIMTISYSVICAIYIKKLLPDRDQVHHENGGNLSLINLIRPDNIFHYVVIPAISNYDALILKAVRSAIASTKFIFSAWPNHLDNEIITRSKTGVILIVSTSILASTMMVKILTNDLGSIQALTITSIIVLILFTNRYVDLINNIKKEYIIILNFLYLICAVFSITNTSELS